MTPFLIVVGAWIGAGLRSAPRLSPAPVTAGIRSSRPAVDATPAPRALPAQRKRQTRQRDSFAINALSPTQLPQHQGDLVSDLDYRIQDDDHANRKLWKVTAPHRDRPAQAEGAAAIAEAMNGSPKSPDQSRHASTATSVYSSTTGTASKPTTRAPQDHRLRRATSPAGSNPRRSPSPTSRSSTPGASPTVTG